MHFLSGGGEMAQRMRAFDWTSTPLGPPEAWPQGLRTAVRIALTTRHPMFIFWGSEHRCLYNDAYRQSLGEEKHPSILGMRGRDAWPEIWDTIGPQIEMVMRGEGSTWHENQYLPILRHGALEDVYWTYSYGPIDDAASRHGIGGVLVVCTETTRQVLSESARVADAERLRLLFEQSPGFVCVMRGPRHVYELANEAYYELVGSRDLLGKSVVDMFPEFERQGFVDMLDKVYRTGERYVGVEQRLMIHRAAGAAPEERHVTFVYQPIRNESGEVTGIFCSGSDVTESVRAQRAMHESEERFRAAVDAIQGILWTNDASGEMVGPQPSWSKLTGQSEAEHQGYGWTAAVHPDDIAGTVIAWQKAVGTRTMFAHEHRVRRADGSWGNYLIRAVPTFDDQGAINEWVGVHTDITERRTAEAALKELNGLLEQRVRDELMQRSQAEEALRQSQKMDAVGQLTGGIAHDFNNMLAVVLGSLELLGRSMKDIDDPKMRRYVDAAADGARRAAQLTQRLLAFSRQQPLKPNIVDMNALVNGMSELLAHSLGAALLHIELSPDVWLTHADAHQLENVILNLAVNARDASAIGGKIVISTQNSLAVGQDADADRRFVLVSVKDEGCGMTPEVLAKAFDPFFTTKPVGKGTGLGLSQVYGFARQSGGHVEIESAPGQGTCVKVFLPAMTDGKAAERPPAVQPQLEHLGEQQSILLVDDEEAVRRFSAEALESLGYRVIAAASSREALRLIETHPDIALLLTDVVMPEVNGAQLAELVREIRPALPVLFTSGYARLDAVKSDVLDMESNVLGKPFSIQELAVKVRAALASGLAQA